MKVRAKGGSNGLAIGGSVSAIVFFGTVYSVVYDTFLDTSNPLLTHLPHPLHHTHYFASKRNWLNVLFTKKLWAWTSAAFFALFFTSPPSVRTKSRLFKFFLETAMWLLFTGWFFGPSLLERVTASTGGECVVHLPSGAVVTIPSDYCFTKSTISPATHPNLFTAPLMLPDDGWAQIPRLRRGHDVSGHLFLLTMSILFLSEQFQYSFASEVSTWPQYHKWAVVSNFFVVVTALFATYTTSIYFHTPFEKFTGFALGGGRIRGDAPPHL
ncbi:hypothetical protein NM688_g9279 [Phlebia brevispora]|uniref:Uncharacterized protein n=1 Tax=Phlebia brevispora TaxID=194682 RepID=A0ACC1RJB5_9APHY|nr:hypothetical protein NM688_g9279 [Phlebia brevispora]